MRILATFLFFLLSLGPSLMAQDLNGDAKDGYTRGLNLGFHMSTRGLGVNVEYLRAAPLASLKPIFGIRAFGLKDHREAKIESQFRDRGSRYVYGKMHRVMALTPYAGVYHEFIPGNQGNFVSMAISLQAGPIIGLVRPYYVDIFEPSQNFPNFGEPVPQQFNPDLHSYSDIVGVSSFLNSSWSDLSIQPGVSIRTAALINFSRSDSYISGMELGVNLDYFLNTPPILAFVENRQTFVAVSLGMVFGNRW